MAGIGPVEENPEGSLIHHVSQRMCFTAFFLRAVVERLVTSRRLTVGHVTAFVYRSPVFDPTKWVIVETGLQAYLSGDWLVAIHLLVPQIEDSVRWRVGMAGGQTMKKGRHEGLLLGNLDELLRDDRAEQVLGANAPFYLRVLLTDQRG